MNLLKSFLQPTGNRAAWPEDLLRRAGRFSRNAVRVVDFVRRAYRPVLLCGLLLTVVSGWYAVSELRIDTDTAGMLSRELPHRQRYEDYKRAFPQFTDSIIVVIDADSADRADVASQALLKRLRAEPDAFRSVHAVQSDPFFLRNGLMYLDVDELADLSDRLADAQPLLGKLAEEPNLGGLFEVLGEALDEISKGGDVPTGLAEVLDRVAGTAVSVGAGTPRPLSWFEVLEGKTSDAADRRRFIQLQPRIDFTSLQPAAVAMGKIRDIARELDLVPEKGVRVRLTGGAAMSTEELQSVSAGAGLAGLLSLFLVAALLVLGLGSLRLVTAVLLTLVAGLMWTAGFTALAIGHLNLISVAFAVLFIGLGVDFGIHFGLRYLEEARGGHSHDDALGRATAGVARALGLCTVAAAVGFYSFVPTDYTGLSELGLIAGSGMFLALIASFTLLPALLTALPPVPQSGASSAAASTGRLRFDSLVLRHGKRILMVVLGIALVSTVLLPFARFDADPIALKDPTTESVSTFLELMEDSRTAPYTIQVLASDIDSARELATRLDRLEEVDRAITIADFVPKAQDEKLQIIENTSVFMAPLLMADARPNSLSDSARREAVLDMRARLKTFVAQPTSRSLREPAARLELALAGLGTGATALREFERAVMRFLPSRLDRLREALKADRVTLKDLPESLRARFVAADGRARVQVFPKQNLNDPSALRDFVAAVYTVAPNATDAPVQIVEGGRAVAGAVRQATLTAMVLISILLLALLRSVRDTLLVLMPLAAAGVFTVAATVVLGTPFNFANVIVLPLLMGLGVASSIHLVMRVRQEGREASLAQTSTPRAVVFSAMTTVFSFGTLSISSHRGTASMGELLTIAIAFTLICALIFLPALMGWARTEGAEYEERARAWVRTEGREIGERAARKLRTQVAEIWRVTRRWAESEGRGIVISVVVWIRRSTPLVLEAIRDLARRLTQTMRRSNSDPRPRQPQPRRHKRPF